MKKLPELARPILYIFFIKSVAGFYTVQKRRSKGLEALVKCSVMFHLGTNQKRPRRPIRIHMHKIKEIVQMPIPTKRAILFEPKKRRSMYTTFQKIRQSADFEA